MISLSQDIQSLRRVKIELNAYLEYLFENRFENHLPKIELNKALQALQDFKSEFSIIDEAYIYDVNGSKVIDLNKNKNADNDSHLFQIALKASESKSFFLSDPHISRYHKKTSKLVVTASYFLFDSEESLQYIVCVDIILHNALDLIETSSSLNRFSAITSGVYFVLSICLSIIALFFAGQGISGMYKAITHFDDLNIEVMFQTTILLTLALAIFDLVKAIFEEEVLGKKRVEDGSFMHHTMIKFLGSIIIALSIEGLMLVFKFTIIKPENIIYAVYLLGAVSLLLISLSVYIKFISHKSNS